MRFRTPALGVQSGSAYHHFAVFDHSFHNIDARVIGQEFIGWILEDDQIGLFARFSFLAPEFQAYHYVAGYLSIAAGAICWWLLVTFFIDKVRSHFNVRSMWIINRIIASVLLLMSLVGVITGIHALI